MLSKKFCPRCGRETEEFYMGLCLDCYIATKVKIPKKITIKKCRKCEKFIVGKRPVENIFKAVEDQLVKILKHYEIPETKIGYRILDPNILILKLGSQEYKIRVKIKKSLCSKCEIRERKKLEVIFQLRGKGSTKFEKVVEYLVNRITENRFIEVKDVKELKTGIDLECEVYNISELIKINREIKKNFGIKPVETRKLIGMQDSRRIYKSTILYRIDEG